MKIEKKKFTNFSFWASKYFVFPIILVLTIIACESEGKRESVQPPVEFNKPKIEESKQYINETCIQTEKSVTLLVENEKITDIQREAFWKKYETKWVKWEVKVYDVEEMYDSILLIAICGVLYEKAVVSHFVGEIWIFPTGDMLILPPLSCLVKSIRITGIVHIV